MPHKGEKKRVNKATSNKIRKLKAEGKPQKVAVAAGINIVKQKKRKKK